MNTDGHTEDLLRLSTTLQELAAAFPWSDPPRKSRGEWEDMWWWWNAGFVHLAGRLTRSVELLDGEGLRDEAKLPLRSLMELVANQGYMAHDPQSRAPEFAATDLVLRERKVAGLDQLGTFDPESLDALREEIRAVREEMAPLISGATPHPHTAFGKEMKERARAAGMKWHYEGVYATLSDFVHMNARAVSQYVSRLQGEREDEPSPANNLMACEFLIRSLYFGDLALEQGRRDDLDRCGREYARIALPAVDPDAVLQRNLWPPQIRSV